MILLKTIVDVKYQWNPIRCLKCKTFGHSCSNNLKQHTKSLIKPQTVSKEEQQIVKGKVVVENPSFDIEGSTSNGIPTGEEMKDLNTLATEVLTTGTLEISNSECLITHIQDNATNCPMQIEMERADISGCPENTNTMPVVTGTNKFASLDNEEEDVEVMANNQSTEKEETETERSPHKLRQLSEIMGIHTRKTKGSQGKNPKSGSGTKLSPSKKF